MAGNTLTSTLTADADPAGTIAAYLAALDRALRGPRWTRVDICDEVRDGLLAAADRRRTHGADRAAAVQAALAEFGPPELVARAFAAELATARERRLLSTLLLTGPLVGVWWLLLLGPQHWPSHAAELVAAIPVLPVVGATTAGAVAVLAATGRLAHRLPALSPHRTVGVAHACAVACLAVDVTLLAQLALLAATGPAAHPPALMAAAGAASLVRLAWAGLAAGRCRRSAPAMS